MVVQTSDFVRVPQLPSGRALYALRRSARAVEGDDDLMRLVDMALTRARATRELELAHRDAKAPALYGPKAGAIDGAIDRTLSAIDSTVRTFRSVFGQDAPDDERSKAAEKLARELFPRGVLAVTSLSFVEEHESVTIILAKLQEGGALASEAEALGLGVYVSRLAALNEEFGAELERAEKPSAPTWDQIRAARAAQQDAIVRFVATAAGKYASDDSAESRDAVLGPILEQQNAMAKVYRGRTSVRDVNPETGVEESVEGEPMEPPPADAAGTA